MIYNCRPVLVDYKVKLFDVGSWLSGLIKLFTRCKYNHSALMFDMGGKTFVAEARSAGVVVATLREWKRHRPDKKWITGFALREIKTERVAYSFGVPYDVKSLFQQAIFITTGKWIGEHNLEQVNCSEVVAFYYNLPQPWLWTAAKLYKSDSFKWHVL